MSKTQDSPIERIKKYQEAVKAETENLKTDIARQLQKAADTLKVLKDVGVPDIWRDPQFNQPLSELGLFTVREVELAGAVKGTRQRKSSGPRKTRKRGSESVSGQIAAYLKANKGEHSVQDIQKATGAAINTVRVTVSKMAKDKAIKKGSKRGLYSA